MSATTTKPKASPKPKPDHIDGEDKAEHEAKAKATAAAKAEADRLATITAEAEAALAPISAELSEHAAQYLAACDAERSSHLSIGWDLLAAEKVLRGFSDYTLTIRQYAERELPADVTGPVYGSSPACRALYAARVAEKVRGGIGTTSVDALQPFHRLIHLDAAARHITAAFKLAGRMAKDRGSRRITANDARAAVEELFPKVESSTPGPARGSEAAKAGANAKAAKAKATRNEPTKGEVSEVPNKAVSAITLKAAAQRWATFVGTFPTAEAKAIALQVAAFTVKACTDQGIGATDAAVKEEAAKLTAAKPKAKAAKPKPTTTKPTAAKPKATRTTK